jgi:hypothetical protein
MHRSDILPTYFLRLLSVLPRCVLRTLLLIVAIPVYPSSSTSTEVSPPYPASEFIADVSWTPESEIVRAADGSDTWPITWGDDGNLYTAFGDGWGFSPNVPPKLSLGFAIVSGGPDNFRGNNIRSDGEQDGNGSSGKKACGMLMVDGTLYMWVRNDNNDGAECRLAMSEDRAQTWTWSPWQFTEFGYCTFINFGRDYSGARDSYVYVVSHDHPSAYTPADDFILARVPKDQVGTKSSYEFFQKLDSNGAPLWTDDITQRGSVFHHAGNALRSGISYNEGLKRYLWWQQVPKNGVDTRFKGGFGIYEAPEPWGPWKTVYFTEDWDVGPGETASFPTKWMSADGTTVNLVFSGDDHFSVREVTFTVRGTRRLRKR